MKLYLRHGVWAAAAVAAALGTLACAQDAEPDSQSAFQTESVVRAAANEELGSHTLRQLICDAIVAAEGAGAHDDTCTGFSYTITEFAKSTRYGHLEGEDLRPITMQMKVAVENPATSDTYDATLTRELDQKFELKFKAEIGQTDLQQIHRYIRDLANRAGEYGDWWDDDVKDDIRAIPWDALPAQMQDAFNGALQQRNDWLSHYPDEPSSDHATFSDEMPFLEILMEGLVVGYVLNVDDYIDHPLWDGSGIHYYFDKFGTEVTTVDWSG